MYLTGVGKAKKLGKSWVIVGFFGSFRIFLELNRRLFLRGQVGTQHATRKCRTLRENNREWLLYCTLLFVADSRE